MVQGDAEADGVELADVIHPKTKREQAIWDRAYKEGKDAAQREEYFAARKELQAAFVQCRQLLGI